MIEEKEIFKLDDLSVSILTTKYLDEDKTMQVGDKEINTYMLAEPEIKRLKEEQPIELVNVILNYWKVDREE